MGNVNVSWQKSFHEDNVIDPVDGAGVMALSAFLLSSLPSGADRRILLKEMWDSGAEVIVRLLSVSACWSEIEHPVGAVVGPHRPRLRKCRRSTRTPAEVGQEGARKSHGGQFAPQRRPRCGTGTSPVQTSQGGLTVTLSVPTTEHARCTILATASWIAPSHSGCSARSSSGKRSTQARVTRT